jgi:N-acetylmuramoyl-L-alanine amidase
MKLLNLRALRWRVFVCLGLLCIGSVQAQVRVDNVRAVTKDDSTRLVLETSGVVDYRKFHLSSPDRLVIDLRDTSTRLPPALFELDDSRIANVRAARRGDGVRLVFDLTGDIPSKAFTLQAEDGRPARLVVDLVSTISSTPAQPSAAPSTSAPAESKAVVPAPQPQGPLRDIIVAIDPGHGGKDPGALGRGGVREKNVVLEIAKRLKAEFDAIPGFQGVLTRSGDTFIPLARRPQIARDKNADFFVSLHADSFPKDRRVYGGGVYALSLRGATSETARWLAKRENAVDLSHGVDLGDVEEDIRRVLLNMSMDSAIRISKQAGTKVIAEMKGVARMHRRQLEQANFVVLRSPDIPSLLVELGFLSNDQDVARLTKDSEQKKVAQAIRRGIVRYFEASPPPNTQLYVQTRGEGASTAARSYRVKKGDNLSKIAANNGVSLDRLRRANNLSSDNIRIGQRLIIPGS